MKIISLTRGQITLVDDDVYEWASKFKWQAFKVRNGFYATRDTSLTLGPKKKILLHREVMRPAEGFETAHKDGNGLNNLRENLQNLTHAQNMQGKQAKGPNATSRFRGVYFFKRIPAWVAQCKKNGVGHYLGRFQDEIEAAKAYDTKARELFGEHAACNFPEPQTIK